MVSKFKTGSIGTSDTDNYIWRDSVNTYFVLWENYNNFCYWYKLFVTEVNDTGKIKRVTRLGMTRHGIGFHVQINGFVKYAFFNEGDILEAESNKEDLKNDKLDKYYRIIKKLRLGRSDEVSIGEWHFLMDFFDNFMFKSGIKDVMYKKDLQSILN